MRWPRQRPIEHVFNVETARLDEPVARFAQHRPHAPSLGTIIAICSRCADGKYPPFSGRLLGIAEGRRDGRTQRGFVPQSCVAVVVERSR